MNTTKLISQWTMQGAARDVGGRFRKTDDIRRILVDDRDPSAAAVPVPLRVRGVDEEDWTALRVGGEGADGRVW
jgi:hypothetical protein